LTAELIRDVSVAQSPTGRSRCQVPAALGGVRVRTRGKICRRAPPRRHAGQTIRLHLTRAGLAAGRHSVTLAQIARGMKLAPGTYVLLVRATDSAGQRSNDATVKFFVVTG
jgi:hypothetical protein